MPELIIEFLSELEFGWWILIAMALFLMIFAPMAYDIMINQFRENKYD